METNGLANEIRQKTGMTLEGYCKNKNLSHWSLYKKHFSPKAIRQLRKDGIDVEKYMKAG